MSTPNNIEDLVVKYLSGNATPEDAMMLEDWKGKSNDNQVLFEEYKKIYDSLVHVAGNEWVDTNKAWEKVSDSFSRKPIRPLKKFFSPMSIAATVLLLFSVAIFLFYYLNRPGRETLQYASGDQSIQFKTSDQTEVVLDKNSTLHIDKGFGKKNRTVYLKGIAEFNIKYDQNLPFIVDAGELWIKELGTKFTVSAKTKSDSIRVDVVKGSVLLYDQKGAELNLKAPDMAYYVKSEKRFFQPATASKTQDINLIFRNEKLEDLINTLIHTYDVEIKLQNPALRNCMVTSSFYNEDLETILLIVTETLGLEFEKSKNGYIIKGETCQP